MTSTSSGSVTLDAPAGPLEALLTTPPTGAGPWPGVVLVHDAFGFTADVRNHARRVAEAGYLVVTPRLYSRGGPTCIPAVMRALLTKKGDAVDDLNSAREFLTAREDCTGAVGIAGFCMGGGFSLIMSPKGFAASAPFYGVPLPRPLAETLRGACPIVASFGAKDPMGGTGSADKLERELTAQNIPHDVKAYPGAGHSFANDLPAQPLMRIVGFGRNEEATDDAWNRVFAFFREHLH